MKQLHEPSLSEVLQCARICHEVNRAYCFSIGDSSLGHWANTNPENTAGVIRAVREHLSSRLTLTAEQMHNARCEILKDAGWKRGEFDREKKRTPDLMPYNRLPREEQTKQWLFRAAVHAYFHQHYGD